MARNLSPEIEAAIQRASQRSGLPVDTLRTFVHIESGGNPNLVNKYGYSGLLQLQPSEHRQLGGQGSVLDPDANLTTGAVKIKNNLNIFRSQFNREPTTAELYTMHQQGAGGATQHWKNPDKPAWQNMLSTGEGRQKAASRGEAYAEDWAKRAIWGNVPDDVKRQYGSVDNMKSSDFTKLWESKVARFGGGGSPDMPAPTQAPDPFKGPATVVADASALPQAPNTMAEQFQRPAEAMASAQPAPMPTQMASAGGVPSASAGGDNSLLEGLSAYWQTQEADKKDAETKAARNAAEAKAAIPGLPGASPMIQGPRLARVNMGDILNILKRSGVSPDMAGDLGTGLGQLGTRRA